MLLVYATLAASQSIVRVMNMSGSCKTIDPAQEAYDEAVKTFRTHLTNDEQKKIWIGNYTSIEDVEVVVKVAKDKYDAKVSGNKAKRWLSNLSTRILHYGTIFDVLSQHHPEYVSLAWGSIKFFLTALLNHEELLARIAKALSEIANALPRLKIQVALYKNEAMKHAISMVYAHVIKFFHRAMTWYSASRMKRALSAIWQPFELRFKDLVEEIATCSRTIDQQALTASQIELRQVHIELRQMHEEQQELIQIGRDTRRIIIENQAINFRGFLDSNRRLCEIQFSQILATTAPASLPSPDRAFRQSKFLSTRRRSARPCNDDRLWWQSHKLREWASSNTCSLLLVQASHLSRLELKDFSVDLIDLLLGLQVPVVWALSPGLKTDANITNIDILKQLVLQILQRNHTLLKKQSPSLNPTRFQSAITQQDWFEILVDALVGMPLLYIILDGSLLDSQLETEVAWPSAFRNTIEALNQKCPETVIKVFLTMHSMSNDTGSSALKSFQDITLRLQAARRSGVQRGRQLTGTRNSRLLKPFISQCCTNQMHI